MRIPVFLAVVTVTLVWLGSASGVAAQVLDCTFPHGDRATERASFQFEEGNVLRFCARIVLEPFRCSGPEYKILKQDANGLTAVGADQNGAAVSLVYDKHSGAAQWAGREAQLAFQGTCVAHELQGLITPP